jgi:hypothetical protein
MKNMFFFFFWNKQTFTTSKSMTNMLMMGSATLLDGYFLCQETGVHFL